MDYKQNYINLITRTKIERNLSTYEVHHIIPRSLGGTDELSNLTKLTPREHYLAHYLLWKITTGIPHIKMARVLLLMSDKNKIISSRQYQQIKEEIAASNNKPIICLQSKQVFPSINKAAFWLFENNPSSKLSTIEKNLSDHLRGNRKSIFKYSFDYYMEGKEYEQLELIANKQFSQNAKPIICLQDLKVYNSIREAAKYYNINFKKISSAIIRNGSSDGYTFKIYEENKIYIKEKKKPIHKQINKKIICNETGEIYNSQLQLSKLLKIDRTTLKRYITLNKEIEGFTYSFKES